MVARPGEAIAQYDASISSAMTPAMDAAFTRITRGVYVGASGALEVQFAGDPDSAPVTLTGLAAGVWHPMQIQKIISAGTTATGIVVGF
jgi:hypothetical protein